MGAKSRRRKNKRQAAKAPPPKTPPRGAEELPEVFAANGDGEYRIPRAALRFGLPLEFDLAGLAADPPAEGGDESGEEGGKGSRQSFSVVANSGEVMLNHPFWGNFAIDLDGLSIPRQDQPLLRDHDVSKILGQTKAIRVTDDKQLVAEGEFSAVTKDAEEVLALAGEGFPFQASVFVPPSAILSVETGESVEVNGHKLEGPGHVFTKSELREVTITPLGSDPNTNLALLAQGSNKGEVDTVSLSVSQLSTQPEEDMSQHEEVGEEADTVSVQEAERLAAKAAEEATLAERSRLAGIDELAAGTGIDAEAIAKMKSEGFTVERSAVEIVKLAKAGKAALLTALTENSPDLSAAEGEETEFTETGVAPPEPKKLTRAKLEAMPLGEARFKAEWAADLDKCQSEFSGEDLYVAFRELNEREAIAAQQETISFGELRHEGRV